MYKEQEIEDSLEFCRDIYLYYEAEPKHKGIESYQEWDGIGKRQYERYPVLDYLPEKKYEIVKSKVSFFHLLIQGLICIAIAFIAARVISDYVFQITVIRGNSMEHLVHDGDNVLIDKLFYKTSQLQRFDVIVFSKESSERNLIKRIIGLPGETVKMEGASIYIDGSLLEENYALESEYDANHADIELSLEENEYFVLGDNRNDSLDSRYVQIGPVKENEIIGKAWARVYPFQEIRLLHSIDKKDS
ncbi:signal peptidase I [Anaeromicropila populeti]|uniref:Signal peptidase I n=1 Tax=Anaeromicropila populeti TaxID=37658 RepID=A0A1I6L783_9FIRM|nr:signal peptidase I [Anaeromicropila populeti]SFR99297.1 signal peptidase I [Anaeromicropila populeti]